VNLLILLLVCGAVAYRVITPADRARYMANAATYMRELQTTVRTPRPDYVAFVAALHRRTPRVVVAPALIVLNVCAAIAMLSASASFSDPTALVRVGANLGTRTTNGEWGRLVTSAFLNGGVLQLVIVVVVLLQLGAIVERLVGRASLAAVYVAAGALGSVRHISTRPIAVGTSAAAAICGVYGLMAACVLWQLTRGSSVEPNAADGEDPGASGPLTIPPIAIKRLAVVGAVFFVISMLDATTTAASELAGFVAGVAYGLATGYAAAHRTTGWRAVGATFSGCVIAAFVFALPLRNIADVKPALDAVIATEMRTADTYKEALDRFSHQRISAEALADIAEKKIVPELHEMAARVDALEHVPAEHQPVVLSAQEFLRLRSASWQARADALRRTHGNLRAAAEGGGGDAGWRVQAERRFRSSLASAGKAEAAERTASEAFERLRYSWRPIAE